MILHDISKESEKHFIRTFYYVLVAVYKHVMIHVPIARKETLMENLNLLTCLEYILNAVLSILYCL